MERFTDCNGKQFIIKINIGAALSVQDLTGYNILNPAENQKESSIPFIGELVTDDLLFARILAAIVFPQLEQNGIKENEFFEALDGATVKSAQEAFLKEYNRFFTERGALPIAALVQEAQDRLKLAQVL